MPWLSPFRDFCQAKDVLALVMPSCQSGGTSPSSLNITKTQKSARLTSTDGAAHGRCSTRGRLILIVWQHECGCGSAVADVPRSSTDQFLTLCDVHLEQERVSQAACLQRRQLALPQEPVASLRHGSCFTGSTLQESYGSHCRRGPFLVARGSLSSLNVHRTLIHCLCEKGSCTDPSPLRFLRRVASVALAAGCDSVGTMPVGC